MRLRLFARRPATPPTATKPVPLHDPETALPPGAIPFDVALRISREALARHQNADISSRPAMYFAAVDLEHALRTLVTALDHPQDT
ncbi:hypothetical protein L1085_016255 [Streptomyces sp. MSC1_001]|jgi:hypothetical protein|uniref:hypothetical protein n=1 Tax=Streptomyces sp. MSC1_001 TaxID=2909263 RepID=UPI00202FB2C9|nr:hypothetical protein [Streptomyces sp. MSC1_001]